MAALSWDGSSTRADIEDARRRSHGLGRRAHGRSGDGHRDPVSPRSADYSRPVMPLSGGGRSRALAGVSCAVASPDSEQTLDFDAAIDRFASPPDAGRSLIGRSPDESRPTPLMWDQQSTIRLEETRMPRSTRTRRRTPPRTRSNSPSSATTRDLDRSYGPASPNFAILSIISILAGCFHCPALVSITVARSRCRGRGRSSVAHPHYRLPMSGWSLASSDVRRNPPLVGGKLGGPAAGFFHRLAQSHRAHGPWTAGVAWMCDLHRPGPSTFLDGLCAEGYSLTRDSSPSLTPPCDPGPSPTSWLAPDAAQ